MDAVALWRTPGRRFAPSRSTGRRPPAAWRPGGRTRSRDCGAHCWRAARRRFRPCSSAVALTRKRIPTSSGCRSRAAGDPEITTLVRVGTGEALAGGSRSRRTHFRDQITRQAEQNSTSRSPAPTRQSSTSTSSPLVQVAGRDPAGGPGSDNGPKVEAGAKAQGGARPKAARRAAPRRKKPAKREKASRAEPLRDARAPTSVERRQQCPRGAQVGGVDAVGEARVDRLEDGAGRAAGVGGQERREAHRRAQGKGAGALLDGEVERGE